MAVFTPVFLLLILHCADSSLSRSVLVREGADAVLTCPNVEPGQSLCRKTTWTFVPAGGSRTVELISLGQINSSVSELLSERLTLTEQCGLRIQHVRPQEAGTFQCEQYEREEGSFISQSSVHLSVVSLTEEEEEQSLKLRCAVSSRLPGVTVRLILQGRVLNQNNPGLQQISQNEVVFTLDHFLHQNKHLFTCEVTVGDQTEVFSFERENSKSRDQTTTNPTDAPDSEDRTALGSKV
ncbi:hypothetical protein NL108_013153 [Boleophthalmus pectinirostris]|nr:hypothetical protein NL108_013153 [Boleophthalmus pectinirostris]